MKSNLFPIAREGWTYLAFSLLVFIVSFILNFSLFSFIAFSFSLFFLYIFRNPEREIMNYENKSFLSACDGTVKSIAEIEDSNYLYKIEIDSTCYDVGILRVPMNATLKSMTRYNGTRVATDSKLFNTLNEYAELIFQTSDATIKIRHQLKRSAVPLFIHDTKKEQELQQSFRYGFMTNGITTLYIPSNFRLNINIGDKLKASESLIGYCI